MSDRGRLLLADAPLFKAKHTRRCHTKSRSGCATCKARRIKCDEAKPVCRKCKQAKRICVENAVIHPSLFDPNITSLEARYLQYFQEVSVPLLCNYFDRAFWTGSLLRLSPNSQGLKHAICALAAVHESLLTVDAIWPVPECSTALTQFALEQNLKALQAFRSETPSAEEVLASCLVFVRFEILQGEFLEAIRILSKGLSVHQEQVGFSQGQEASEIDYEITYAFSRLRMRYSTSIGDWQCLQQHMLEDKEQSDSFLNLKEARQFFDTLADQTSAVITQLRNPEPGQDNPDTAKYSLMCERDWVIWRQKFDNFITSYREQTPDNLERQAMLLLRMHQLVAWVRLHTASSPSEMVYDAFMTEYREIVRAAEEFMGLIDPGAKTTGSSFQSQSIIAFDLGVITPLAFVAITCRDFILRRRCVELLYRRHRREDLWDSHLVAVVSAAIIDLEEEPSSQIANLKKHEPALSSSPSPKANVSLDLLPSEKRIRCVDFARSVLGPSPNEGNRMMVEERIGYKRFPWDQTVIVESVAKTVQIRRTMAPMNVGPSVLFQNIMYFGSGLGAWNSPMPSKHSAASN